MLLANDFHKTEYAGSKRAFTEACCSVDVDSEGERNQIGFTISDNSGDHRVEVALAAKSKASKIVTAGASGYCGPCLSRRVGG